MGNATGVRILQLPPFACRNAERIENLGGRGALLSQRQKVASPGERLPRWPSSGSVPATVARCHRPFPT